MLYQKISGLCKDRNITIAKLEKECSLGNATIRKWKTSSPGLNNLKKVADYFGVSIGHFLSEKGGDQGMKLTMDQWIALQKEPLGVLDGDGTEPKAIIIGNLKEDGLIETQIRLVPVPEWEGFQKSWERVTGQVKGGYPCPKYFLFFE